MDFKSLLSNARSIAEREDTLTIVGYIVDSFDNKSYINMYNKFVTGFWLEEKWVEKLPQKSEFSFAEILLYFIHFLYIYSNLSYSEYSSFKKNLKRRIMQFHKAVKLN